jgi:small subunit ribosomal protein S6
VGANPGKGGKPLRTYELVFIAQPDLDEEHLNALVEQVQQVITTNGGEMVKTELVGRRRLAYPIRKRREGHYVLMHANMETVTLSELDRALKLSEDVLRTLMVRLDEMTE